MVVREVFVLTWQVATGSVLVHLFAENANVVVDNSHLRSNSSVQVLLHFVHLFSISSLENLRVGLLKLKELFELLPGLCELVVERTYPEISQNILTVHVQALSFVQVLLMGCFLVDLSL